MINRPFRCRAALREIVIPALTICFLFSLMGCGRDSSEQRADPLSSQSNLSRVAQKLLSAGVADEAAVELAKRIELAVKDAASTRQFLSELDLQDASVDRVAAECLLERALRDESDSVAVAALEMMVEQSPQNTRWLAMLWQGHMEIGRTWEASQSADRLSRQGAATAAQLLSLIRRSEVFPVEESSPKPSGFEAWVPLKRARWFVSREQYAEAEAALRPLWISQFADPAAAALYLRVLAELQRTDQFCQLHADWHAELLDRADYWCAAGQFLLDQSEYQAAAGALLRAVNIDPTMRIAYQRLSRCMKSLGRNDDAEQFRHLGLQVAASETIARRIDEQPDNLAAKSDLAQLLLELNRPFEALEWTRLTIPESDAPRRALLARRRYQLASSPGVEQAAVDRCVHVKAGGGVGTVDGNDIGQHDNAVLVVTVTIGRGRRLSVTFGVDRRTEL